MRKLTQTLASWAILAWLMPLAAVAQNAHVQVIHNSPDALAATVDIYINGGATPAINDLDFREATPFLAVPANITVGIAPGNSTGPSDIIASFPYTLVPGQDYIIIANGVLNPAGYNSTVNGPAIAFDLDVITPVEIASTAGTTRIIGFHGSTDAPQIDVLANGNSSTPFINNLSYGNNSGSYQIVPATEYVLQLTPGNNNSTVLATYYVDLTPLSGGAAVVFASGFLDPSTNQNGPAFGLFAALPNGTVIALTPVGNARAQVIHNAADPAAAQVDIYINTITDTLKLDNFAFRTATPFIDLPTGYPVDVVIALPTSTGITNGVVATIPVTAMSGESYHIVANGVLAPGSFAANPNGVSTAFDLLIAPGAQESAASGSIAVKALHGSTDAPSVGVNANGNVLIPSFTYKDFVGTVTIPAAEYRIDVTAANAPGTVIAPFYLDGSGLGGGAALVFASGFLTPSANQNGPAFGLFAALPNGTVAALTPVGNARAQVIHNAADPAAAQVDVYVNTLTDTLKLDNFAFRTATPFIDLPTGYPVDVVIALPTSTGITNGVVATIPFSAMAGESYHLIANGVLNPATFAANPDGVSTAFNLFALAGAREAAINAATVDVKVFHGATDAPTVDALVAGVPLPLIDDLSYTESQGYVSVPPASYVLQLTPGNNNSSVIASYVADVSGLAGGAGIILASGFLTPSTNQNGEAFGLLLVLPDGTAFLLPFPTSIQELEQDNSLLTAFPNPAREVLNLNIARELPGDYAVRMLDVQGREVFRLQGSNLPGSLEVPVSLSNIASGLYTVELITETSYAVRRIQVQK